MTTHPCSWPDCDRRINTDQFACSEHWDLLPESERVALSEMWHTRRDTALAYSEARDAHERLKERIVARLHKQEARRAAR